LDQEQITLEIDERPAVAAAARANTALDGVEAKTKTVLDSAGKQWTVYASVVDKSRSSIDRMVKSMEQQSAVYGKSGVDKLMAQQAQLLAQWEKSPRAIDAITKSFTERIRVEKEAAAAALLSGDAAEGAGPKWQKLGLGIKDVFEGRMAYGQVEAGKFIGSLNGMALGAGVAVGAIIALGFAFKSAMTDLASYGVMVKDVELRTGFTAKEVGQFGFAAKVAGTDITVFEHAMRGLTEAVEDQSATGDKGRAWLKKFGIDMADVRNGTVSTSQVMMLLSDGLDKLPNVLERNKVGADVFKRAWLELAPAMDHLRERAKLAQEQGFGPSESDVVRMDAYNLKVALLDTQLAEIKRNFEEGIVINVSFVGSAFKWLSDLADKVPGLGMSVGGDMGHEAQERSLADDIRTANGAKFGSAPLTGIADLERKRMLTLKPLDPKAAYLQNPDPATAQALFAASNYQKQIVAAQQAIGAADGAEKQKQIKAAGDEADRLRNQYFGGHDALERAYTDAKKDVEKYQLQLVGAKADKKPMSDVQDIGANLAKAAGAEARAKGALDAAHKADEEQKHQVTLLSEWRHQAAELNRKDDEAELSAIGKIYYATDQLIKLGFATKGTTASELIAVQRGGDARVAFELNKANDALSARSMSEGETGNSHVNLLDRGMKGEGWMAEDVARMNADREARDAQAKKDEETRQRIYSTQYDSQKDSLNRTAGNALKISQASGATGMDAIRDSYQIRIELAKQLAVIAGERIAKESDHDKQQELFATAQKDLQKEMSEAAEESLLKQLELQKQQLEVLKKDTEGLWNTLLTKPGQFGKQLADTVHSAVIKPISEGMATVTSRVLKPVIYGADGDGGISGAMKGLFGQGKQDPMKLATDMNTAVTAQNSAALSMLTAILAGAMGMSAPAMASAPSGIGGMSAPAISVSAPSVAAPLLSAAFRAPSGSGGGFASASSGGFLPMLFGGGAPGAAGIQSRGGGFFPSQSFGSGPSDSPDVTSGASGGAADLFSLPSSSHTGNLPLMAALFGGGSAAGGSQGGGGSNPMAALFGGGGKSASSAPGGSMAGNFTGMLKGFKGNLGGLTRSDGSYTTNSDTGEISDTSGGKINGVNGLAGAALMGGGMMLAQHGLLGADRGTNKGILEGAGGGAMIGMQMGGPLGAAIGAVAGAGIGLGEKLAGVESPENKAKRLCKQIYGISIDNGMAKQIASLAQSKYGGNVTIAVRDPDTRKMLQLYATGTGQKFPLSAMTPQAGSLQEQNGQLSQVASYQNGLPYTFQSSLPVAGGLSAGTYPSPSQGNNGGATNVTLSLNGQSAADVLEGRVASTVTPGFVQDQYASAQSFSNGRVDNSAMMQQPGLLTS
jgi:hypothetical protein